MEILLLDDNPSDVRLFREAFRALRIRHRLQIASGPEALKFFSRKRSSKNLPALILLSATDALDLLRAIRAHSDFRVIPVVLLSSSSDERRVYQAYQLGANAYVHKPKRNFADLVGDIHRFWCQRAELPASRTRNPG